jgi:hypothetical protein
MGSIVMGKVTVVHVLHADVELTSGTIRFLLLTVSVLITCFPAIFNFPGRCLLLWGLHSFPTPQGSQGISDPPLFLANPSRGGSTVTGKVSAGHVLPALGEGPAV